MSKAYDPYENVIDVMTEAMEVGHIDKKMFEIIKNPQRETKVYLPVEMDDGTIKVFEGYRVQHSLPSGLHVIESESVSNLDVLKMRGSQYSLRWGERWHQSRSVYVIGT